MSTNTYTTEQGSETSFDMFRLSKSKEIVDVCPNTLRSYFQQGLPFYQRGKAVFVSKAELAAFIRRGAAGHRFASANPDDVKLSGPFATGGNPAFQPATFRAAAATAALPHKKRANIRHKRMTEQELRWLLGVQTTEGGAA